MLTVPSRAGFVLPRHLRTLSLGGILFSCLPSCISAACLPILTRLCLTMITMDEKDLQFLGRLPELHDLFLTTNVTVSICYMSTNDNGYFQNLRTLYMPKSMIQFRCEGDSSISFHIWNGAVAMPFGSSKNNHSLAPYAVVPNLEVLTQSDSRASLKRWQRWLW